MLKAFRTIITAVFGFICISILIGCGETDNGVSTDLPNGSGYKISLKSSETFIKPKGSVMIHATVYGPGDVLVKDDEEVYFSCDSEGTIEGASEGKAKTLSGVATVVYKGPDSVEKLPVSMAVRIFASYRGAVSSVELVAVSESF
ncbi:MAG: hypothetical protein HQM10_13135 [Candidatus Riflebacteria bacterium]|nr:hypothetical protein [Candidatus Riflebacteria bacterium]